MSVLSNIVWQTHYYESHTTFFRPVPILSMKTRPVHPFDKFEVPQRSGHTEKTYNLQWKPTRNNKQISSKGNSQYTPASKKSEKKLIIKGFWSKILSK